VAFLLFSAPAQAERSVALVIGNGLYKHAVRLPNPPADAAAMAAMLQSLGFDVVLGANLGRDAMTDHMSRFAQLTGGADVALLFYAGHAFQLDGKNLLVPTDAEIKTEFDAKQRAIEIDAVLQYTMADAKVKLVLLDGCRDNPFAKQIASSAPKTRNVLLGSGLAEMRPGEGTLIAFATGPGQTALDGEGAHSPFTRALLMHLPAPGVEIRHSLTRVRAQVSDDTHKLQLPWENTNMTGFFYMKPVPVLSAVPRTVPPADMQGSGASGSAFDARELELELWRSVKDSSNPDDFRAYLAKHPNGQFADLARSRAAALSRPADAPVTANSVARSTEAASGDIRTAEASKGTEDALGLDAEAWKDLQRRLTGMGFTTRRTDGRIGDGTRRGLASWQAARGYPSTGYLNRLQHEALLGEVVAAPEAKSKQARRNMDSDAAELIGGVIGDIIHSKMRR
jgi:hypothetical protein